MKNKMKFYAVLSILTIIFSFAFKPLNDKKIIVIDPGHGGQDFGAQIGETLEKKIVENIANKISVLNGKGDIEIVLLREDDSSITLNERVAKVNKINPCLLISLHINTSKNSQDKGVHAYVSKQNAFYDKSMESAKELIEKIANEKLSKGKVNEANFFVIKNSKCPAIVLEMGYLTNENDKTYITSENGQNEIAHRIVEFLKK